MRELARLGAIIDQLFVKHRRRAGLSKRLVFVVGNGIDNVNNIINDDGLRQKAGGRFKKPRAFEAYKWRHFEYARYYTSNTLPSFAHCCIFKFVEAGLCRAVLANFNTLVFLRTREPEANEFATVSLGMRKPRPARPRPNQWVDSVVKQLARPSESRMGPVCPPGGLGRLPAHQGYVVKSDGTVTQEPVWFAPWFELHTRTPKPATPIAEAFRRFIGDLTPGRVALLVGGTYFVKNLADYAARFLSDLVALRAERRLRRHLPRVRDLDAAAARALPAPAVERAADGVPDHGAAVSEVRAQVGAVRVEHVRTAVLAADGDEVATERVHRLHRAGGQLVGVEQPEPAVRERGERDARHGWSPQGRTNGTGSVPTWSAFGSRYSSRPQRPSSRPRPDCFVPPKGAIGLNGAPLMSS